MLQASPGTEPPAAADSSALSLGTRLSAFGALLVAEYLLISLAFDARSLLERSGSTTLLGYFGDAATIALVVAAATLTLMGPELRAAVALLPKVADSRRALALRLVAHVAAYAVFFACTQHVFGGAAQRGPGIAAVAAWVLAGAAVLATWLPLALPWPALRALLPRIATALLLGALAGGIAWLAGSASAGAWSALGPLTLSAVAWLLQWVVADVWLEPDAQLIGTAYFDVHIAPVCSGFEGIGLIVTFLSGYMVLERKALRFPRVLVLLPIAVIAVWCANAVRIALLILVGSYVSPELAVSGFHSKAGWLFFCVVALGFVALARRSRYFAAQPADRGAAVEQGPNLAAPYLVPLLTLLAAALVTGLFTVGFDYLYPVRIACAGCALWWFRAHYLRMPWAVHWDSVGLGVAVYVLWRVLAQGADAHSVEQLEAGLAAMPKAAAVGWLLARGVGMSLVVPLVEELAFRGYLLRRLMSPEFDRVDARKLAVWPIVASSVAFGAVHGADWLPGILAGVAFAWAQQRRGRVTDAVVAHGVANLLLSAEAAVSGNFRFWA